VKRDNFGQLRYATIVPWRARRHVPLEG